MAEDPRAPFVAMPLLVLGFWALEAGLHAAFFDERTFLQDLLRPDPHELWMRITVVVVLTAAGLLWRIAARERTERIGELEEYQRRLQALTMTLAYADVEERHALSKRLHEDVGQQLAAARLFLGALQQAQQVEAEELLSVSQIVERTIAECREIAQELSPPALAEYGMADALESLARRVMRTSGTSIDLQVEGECVAAGRESAFVAFQVIAEVLDVATRLTDSTSIVVECTGDGRDSSVAVKWSGQTTADLFSARERIAGIGGALTIRFGSGENEVRITLPAVSAL